MKILLATFGSLGDVQPMLALSLALRSAGHDVLLTGRPEKAGWAAKLGCPFRPLGSNLTAFIDGMKDAHSLSSALRFGSYIQKELIAQFDVLPEIISGVELAVSAFLEFALSTIAEHMGIHYRFIAFSPQLLRSGHHPFPTFRIHGLPQWYNRMTWRMFRTISRLNLTRIMNKKRRQLGLRPVKDPWLHILGKNVIVASDKAIAEVPPDLGFAVTQTGYMHLNRPGHPIPDLEAFFDAGPPPVYAGFGSMAKQDQAGNVPMIVDAVRSAGQRVMIAKFWDAPSRYSDSNDVFFIKKHPHLLLFPRMAAVIHHGDAGTTASTAISGVPQIIVPHALDQYYWGHQIYRSRLGPKPIWRCRLTARKLAKAVQECLSNDRIRQNAKVASAIIKEEDSLEMTVREILKTPNEEFGKV